MGIQISRSLTAIRKYITRLNVFTIVVGNGMVIIAGLVWDFLAVILAIMTVAWIEKATVNAIRSPSGHFYSIISRKWQGYGLSL